MDGFQDEKLAWLMPYCFSIASQVSPEATMWKVLQLAAKPDWVGMDDDVDVV